jgi:pimeloyl-ACP methyl ester carboxylesterase
MAPTRGLLYVTMQPKDGLSLSQFNDWYNNEHGPNRLRLPFFETGYRYRAIDRQEPEFMALYDVDDMAWLDKEIYTRLRAPPVQSQRERDTMKQIKIDRRFYDAVGEMAPFGEGESWLVVRFARKGEEAGVHGEGERLNGLRGWKASRRFCTSTLDLVEHEMVVWIHEFGQKVDVDEVNKLVASSSSSSSSSPGAATTRIYERFYTFGPAPRDLASPDRDTIFPDGQTRVFTNQAGGGFNVIESYITTSDGVQLPYRLEGSNDPNAPLIVLINSILVDYGIWDAFVTTFLSSRTGKPHRLLRFNSRGRSSSTGPSTATVTVDRLASDAIELLDALKVPRAAAVIGVSLGGATALNVALLHPTRLASFVSCDTNAMAPPGNPAAWEERIQLAEEDEDAATDVESGERVVGESLAEVTVRRWFTADGYAERSEEIGRVKAMVTGNSLEGFKKGVKALYQYDFRDGMKEARTKGLFLVGGGDGVLPKTMKGMADMYGDGTSELVVIDKAGHLPMVERPEEFTRAIERFLQT